VTVSAPAGTILLATTNPGKIREIAAILEGAPVSLVTLTSFPDVEEPDETGATFSENARLKALYYSDATGLPSVADDSGLEIEALDNAPGVHSARWHGSDYAVKFKVIYQLLRERGLATSPARFVAAVAFAEDGQITFESRGVVEGEIAREPAGTHGFGYDPVFYYPPLGCTLAQVDGDAKARVSHRGAAFRAFKGYLVKR
jgi:non-canonical purine NTP pyrophosphatase (RdgB/HAM1 family)